MDRIDRRTYLVWVAGGAVAIAGCAGGDRASMGTRDLEAKQSFDAEQRLAVDEHFDATDETAESSAQDEPPRRVGVGDRLSLGDLHIVVANISVVEDVPIERHEDVFEADTGSDDEILAAPRGDAFAVVDLAVQQVGGNSVIDVEDALRVAFTDGSGESHDLVDQLERPARAVLTGRLAPGEVVRGNIVYPVPADARRFVVRFQSPKSGETVVVDTDTRRTTDAGALRQHLRRVLEFSQEAERAGVVIRVSSLEHGNNLGGFLQSDEGYEVVAVGVTAENVSGRDRTLSQSQVQLKDGSGRLYDETPMMVGSLESLDDVTLADGEEHEGKIAYQVEEGREELFWVLDLEEWGVNQRLFWRLR